METKKSNSLTKYQKQQKGGGEKGYNRQLTARGRELNGEKTRARLEGDKIDLMFGFDRLVEGPSRVGWLLNYLPVTMPDETGMERSGMDLYFLDREGGNFKATIFYEPYFYVDISDGKRIIEVTQHLLKIFEGCKVVPEDKEDLDMANHLTGKKHKFLKISFSTVNSLVAAKKKLRYVIQQNQKSGSGDYDYFEDENNARNKSISSDPLAIITDLREHDVPYTMRVSIDIDLRVGAWYVITPEHGGADTCNVQWQKDMLELCEPKVLAFDIECEKSPLKFPNAEVDRIFMISYMVSGQGYLIINREIVAENVQDFEYTPKPNYPGPFIVFNEKDEAALLQKFISHLLELKPHVIVTYNGDNFDWPYVETRCANVANISLYSQIGIRSNKNMSSSGESSSAVDIEYTGRCMVHLDAFGWVQRDSYLPQGNQGLKAVTKSKLGYDPVEVDPEDMVRFARERPHHMASYSVSDAVATFYLYTTYVHNFIFSLSTIIPMGPEDVLRKGSGTLCEALLMVEAYRGNIVCPNKQVDLLESFYEGHLLESETYIGGHVECLEAGVFRADIPTKFNLVPSAFQQLIDNIDRDLAFALETEHGIERSDALNYDEVRQQIVMKLEMLRDSPLREECPIIYHLDVGAMYPNIILTNRLQPSAMVSINDCASCDFNRAENMCKRNMTWTWRGEYSPAGQTEYQAVRRQLTYEKVGMFSEMNEKDQAIQVKNRLKLYANKVYRKTKVTDIQERVNTVCMRENSFYVDTVKAFRDRRYDYKLLTKTYKNKKIEAERKGDLLSRKAAEDREILMDSLQLAHKCILNSFYGYVMRKGARWRSMEMAGIVTHTGAQLIKQARELVEQVGRPLELDTDGIWCILPSSFPQDFKMKTKSGNISVGYPCAMLNADVHERYTNHQYQELSKDSNGNQRKYAIHSECSIFFELDGPYKAMVLPASPEEGKLLKKKYVVFNFDGTIAELKGFELKRRGELELVKIFQSEVFEHFLAGQSLVDCYAAVGAIANRWLDVLDEEGRGMDDQELLELISERKTISKTVDDYEGRKSTSLTTAARLADFLGAEMTKDKGLNCNLIITKLPAGAPVTERAVPVAIFSCEDAMKRYFLRKWMKDSSLDCNDFRDIVDWSYYKERLGKTISKIITIPAGMQYVNNPCPRVEHPIWLQRIVNEKSSGKKQQTIQSSFQLMEKAAASKENALPKFASDGRSDAISLSTIKRSSNLNQYDAALLSPTSHTKRSPDVAAIDVNDLEDFGRTVPSPNKRPVIHSRRGLKLNDESTEEVEEDSPNATNTNDIHDESPNHVSAAILPMTEKSPQSTEELIKWLEDRKSKWKSARLSKKALLVKQQSNARQYGGANNWGNNYEVNADNGKKKPVGVVDFVRNANLAAVQGFWQVIELQESDSPGEFIAWVITSNAQLQKLEVVIPRILLVDVNGRDAEKMAQELNGAKVVRDLPHGFSSKSLFEVSISERKYKRNEKALNLFLCNPQISGVYESQTPLWLRGIIKMGCVARVSSSRENDNNKYFKLQDLELIHVNSHPYLDPKVATFRRIYLYHAVDKNRSNSNGLGIIGLFIIETTNVEETDSYKNVVENLASMHMQKNLGSTPMKQPVNIQADEGDMKGLTDGVILSAKAFVWMISGTSSFDARPPFQRLYRKFQPNETYSVKFTTNFVASISEGMERCNEKLSQYQRERHGPTIVIAQGTHSPKQWRHAIPMLQDFPLATMPANSLDNLLPAVGWQLFVAERMIQRFLIFPRWFEDRLVCSRYAQIPVCNLGADSLTTMIDVIYSRHLVHNRHALWASEGSMPDLGGAELEDRAIWSDPLTEPIINNPGVYRNVCVELDVYGLAVCSIMSSVLLDTTLNTSSTNNADAAQEEGNTSNGATNNTTDSSCSRAFNIFKSIVAKCIEDVGKRSNTIADSILIAVYRYLCGYGNGLLSDPALHRIIYSLMVKLFKKLIGGLKRLGTTVVYADFSRIIVATNKKDMSAAEEYVQFILNAIISKDTFAYLEVNIKGYWEQLIWLDPENWGGMPLESAVSEEVDHLNLSDDLLVEQNSMIDQNKFQENHNSKVALTNVNNENNDYNENAQMLEDNEDESLTKKSKVTFKESNNEIYPHSSSNTKHTSLTASGKVADEYGFLDDINESSADISLKKIKNTFKLTSSTIKRSVSNSLSVVEKDSIRRHRREFMYQYRSKRNELLMSSNDPLAIGYVGDYHSIDIDHINHNHNHNNEDMVVDGYHADEVYKPFDEDDVRERLVNHMKGFIKHSIGSKVLEIVDELLTAYAITSNSSSNVSHNHNLHSKILSSSAFPKRAGSHLNMTSPALEFVKATTHIMSLDTDLKDEVDAMKRMLLTQLKVREFSEDSKFRDPCLSYRLRDVICTYCSTC
eukprot:gene11543-15462_t